MFVSEICSKAIQIFNGSSGRHKVPYYISKVECEYGLFLGFLSRGSISRFGLHCCIIALYIHIFGQLEDGIDEDEEDRSSPKPKKKNRKKHYDDMIEVSKKHGWPLIPRREANKLEISKAILRAYVTAVYRKFSNRNANCTRSYHTIFRIIYWKRACCRTLEHVSDGYELRIY